MGVAVGMLAAWPADLGELAIQFVLAGSILFGIAAYYGARNDPYWLTPGLFFVGLEMVCWIQNWRLSLRFSGPVFDAGGAIVVIIVGAVGAIALALMKAEAHALRRRGLTG